MTIKEWFKLKKMQLARFIKYDFLGLPTPKEDLFNDEKNASLVDISYLNINRELTKEEKEKLKTLEKELDKGDLNSFISYGQELGNSLLDKQRIIMDYMAKNQEIFKSIKEDSSTENIIKINLDLSVKLNKLKTVSTLLEIEQEKRECELRIIALENKFKELEKRANSKGLVRFFGEDTVNIRRKLGLINDAITRLTVQINTTNSIIMHTTKIIATVNEFEKSINEQLEKRDAEENERITRELLKKMYNDAERKLNTLSELVKNEKVPRPYDYSDLRSAQELIRNFALEEKFIDIFMEKHKTVLNEKLEISKKVLDKILEKLEDLYTVSPEDLSKMKKYHYLYYRTKKNEETLRKTMEIFNLFGEKVSKEDREKCYKAKLYNQIIAFDNGQAINGDDDKAEEEEKEYYLKYQEMVKQKVLNSSSDRALKKYINDDLRGFSKFLIIRLASRLDRFGVDGIVQFDHFTYSENSTNMLSDLDSFVHQSGLGWIIYNLYGTTLQKKYRMFAKSANAKEDNEKEFDEEGTDEVKAIVNKNIYKDLDKKEKDRKWNKAYIDFGTIHKENWDENPKIVIRRIHIGDIIACFAKNVGEIAKSKDIEKMVIDKILNANSLIIEEKRGNEESKTKTTLDENGELKLDFRIVYPKNHPEFVIQEMVEQFTEALMYESIEKKYLDGTTSQAMIYGLEGSQPEIEVFTSYKKALTSNLKYYLIDLISKKMYIPTMENLEQKIKEGRLKVIDKYIADRHSEKHSARYDIDLSKTTKGRLFSNFYDYIEWQFSDSKVIETFFRDRRLFNLDYNQKLDMFGSGPYPFKPYIDEEQKKENEDQEK